MNRVLSILMCCLFILPVIAVAQSESDEQQIRKLEQEWTESAAKNDPSMFDKYEAEDSIATDQSGAVTNREQDKKSLSSGDSKVESLTASDVRVKVYGNAAVATGLNTVKGTYKGQSMNGQYRFTDTWIKRDGKWQCVASQSTKVQM